MMGHFAVYKKEDEDCAWSIDHVRQQKVIMNGIYEKLRYKEPLHCTVLHVHVISVGLP